jgi:hypothetical protein
MHRPRMTSVPDELLNDFIENTTLKGKALVKDVYSCPAYSMYLSGRSECSFRDRPSRPTWY